MPLSAILVRMDDRQTGPRAQPVQDLTRGVPGSVVDDNDFARRWQVDGQQPLNDRGDRASFVVYRDDNGNEIRHVPSESDDTLSRSMETLGVVGAGNMGSGIAQKMATEGFAVVLADVDDHHVARGLGIIDAMLAQGVERRVLTNDAARDIRGRIRGTSHLEDLAGATLVVEAVFEDLQVKKDVFARLDGICRSDAILATNTSSFTVSEIAAVAASPARVLGLHYFFHPAKNRLVEVIAGARTDPAVFTRAWRLQEVLGKTAIASRDSYGFIVNRFFVPWLMHAVRLLDEGVATIATIDEAAKQAFGIGMGPFELMNVTGLPIALHASTTLAGAFGPIYEPPALLKRRVDGQEPWDLGGTADPDKFAVVADRLMAVTFYIVSALVDEGVGSVEDTDIGARVGLRWRRGPFELMNQRGIEPSAALTAPFAETWGAALPDTLARQRRIAKPFAFSLVRSEIKDGIATLTINRPDAMNALSETVITQLTDAFRRAADDFAVRGIVIAGSGKAFVAGADIRFFVRSIDARDFNRIVRFTRAGQDLLSAIGACPKLVVARLHGMALGGGLELALACHVIVATPKASMAFPETGIGIYPGLGGTQRTTRRVGKGLAKWLVLTGETIGALDALTIGLVDRVVPHEELDAEIAAVIAEAPRSVGSHRQDIPVRYCAVAEWFERYQPGVVPDSQGAGVQGFQGAGFPADELVTQAAKRLATKAPIALRMSADLIDRGAALPLQQALDLELARLVEIFSTKDAYEGLSSLGKRRPEFVGS
jgi:enoyl-CoA hydratase/3-hydroxyacyl-CoA dehydrogenase